MPGTCPKCGQIIGTILASPVDIDTGTRRWSGLAYHCPNAMCQAILGCEIDPIAVKTDIVNEIKKLLKP